MKVIGLVVEYNPFHNGHLHHLEAAKKEIPDSSTVAIMSGNWVQRGEPALVNKWARAEMALKAGVDLVLELPTAYALQSAQGFAQGAINTLAATGVVSHLCFGSESANLASLKTMAHLLTEENNDFKKSLQKKMKEGVSYPAAISAAVKEVTQDEEIDHLVSNPNNILAIEYLKALCKRKSTIIPFTIKRKTAGYHSQSLEENIASATAIRLGVQKNEIEKLKNVLPLSSLDGLQRNFQQGQGPVFWHDFSLPLLTIIRNSSISELATYPEIEQGLERRIKEASLKSHDFTSLTEYIKTKRYTLTRIQRILTYILMNIKAKELSAFNNIGPTYLRILGFNEKGQQLLHLMRKEATLPTVIKPSTFLSSREVHPLAKRMLEIDILGTDIHALAYKEKTGGLDFKHPIIKIP